METLLNCVNVIGMLLKIESLSLYWNPKCPTNTLVKAQLNTEGWKVDTSSKGSSYFQYKRRRFRFHRKTCLAEDQDDLEQVERSQSAQAASDFVLQDAASQLSREQVTLSLITRDFDIHFIMTMHAKMKCRTNDDTVGRVDATEISLGGFTRLMS
ncbi:hypothetical protein CEXT_809841 [Caerostris extrusa]|uniref:Uncharacterized protein n=1 Tax=Caerostris extrusa TaxID=172846 RepID=A0AAV4WZL8_CAEEX|nr:hypothetical protein CEXT_809841 [Caerostris extrusa]